MSNEPIATGCTHGLTKNVEPKKENGYNTIQCKLCGMYSGSSKWRYAQKCEEKSNEKQARAEWPGTQYQETESCKATLANIFVEKMLLDAEKALNKALAEALISVYGSDNRTTKYVVYPPITQYAPDRCTKNEQVVEATPGGPTPSQYALPNGAKELQDLIEYREMNFAVGNIFKACYRLGTKDGVSAEYDLNKIIFFAKRELARVQK